MHVPDIACSQSRAMAAPAYCANVDSLLAELTRAPIRPRPTPTQIELCLGHTGSWIRLSGLEDGRNGSWSLDASTCRLLISEFKARAALNACLRGIPQSAYFKAGNHRLAVHACPQLDGEVLFAYLWATPP